MNRDVLEAIFTVNLGVKDDERVLVFTDTIGPGENPGPEERKNRENLREIARVAAEAGAAHCGVDFVEFPAGRGHGAEPPAGVWTAAFGGKVVETLDGKGVMERILAKTASKDDLKWAEDVIEEHGNSPHAVVAMSHYSTSHTRFRDFLNRIRGTRYASMPMFEEVMLSGVMTADWHAVEKRTKALASMMAPGHTVVLTSHNGTNLIFSKKDREVIPDTGIITEPGTFSNLPAGEAFLAPVEGTAEGVLVVEYSPTGELKKPVELEVKKGAVSRIYGEGAFADELRDRIGDNPLCGNIAELGVGTNDRATRPDNILETEKILGTVHVALGDNSSFGGKVSVPFHEDYIFFRPNLEVLLADETRVELLIEGKPKF